MTMVQSVRCRRASHSNIVVENLAQSVKHLEEVFGGRFLLDLPGEDWHACLVEVGGFIAELFEPRNFMLHGRIGAHYLGMEYEANLDEARAAVADHGLGILRDIKVAIHTDPRDGFGVDYEFFDGTFYGPETKVLKVLTETAEHWAAHPVGYTGLIGYTHGVADLEAACAFLKSFLGANPVYEVERVGLGARAIGLKVANDICELVSPTGAGVLFGDMMRSGEGIRSTVYGVKDVAAARAWFEGHALRVIAGTAPGSIAVDPRDNLGILFEFVESS